MVPPNEWKKRMCNCTIRQEKTADTPMCWLWATKQCTAECWEHTQQNSEPIMCFLSPLENICFSISNEEMFMACYSFFPKYIPYIRLFFSFAQTMQMQNTQTLMHTRTPHVKIYLNSIVLQRSSLISLEQAAEAGKSKWCDMLNFTS